MKTLLAIIFCLFLTGCVTQPSTRIITQEVKIPVTVPVYCQHVPLSHPHLPVQDLKNNSTPAENQKAYSSTVDILIGEVLQRDAALRSCEKPK